MPTLAEQLVRSFRELGVKYVFGIPGGPSLPYMEEMRKCGLPFILTANEQSAAIMADVSARLTGVPGVCHATFGPGATNLATGVGGALLDRSPVIALTTEVKHADIGRKVQMNIDHQALFKPLTKWTSRLSKDNFGAAVQTAFRTAVSGVAGPVHLGLPCDIDNIQLDISTLVSHYEPEPLPAPDARQLAKGAEWLVQAKKPVLAVGLTAVRLGLHKALRRFAERTRIPVVLTPMAKGVLPETHPCYAGVLFHAKSEYTASIYREADLVIGLGYDPIEFNYETWMPPVPLLHLDIAPADISPEYTSVLSVTGDPFQALACLNALPLPVFDWNLNKIAQMRAALFEALVPASDTFSPSALIQALQDVLPADGILTADVGAHLHLLGQLWRVAKPNRFLITNGWSSMGFGVPAAIGAKLCQPERTVACVTGDAGFLMNCGELITARRLGLPIIFIVLCDRTLSLIEVKQQRRNAVSYGTDVYTGAYFGADTFLGVPVRKVTDAEGLRRTVRDSLNAAGPVIIEAWVDGSSYQDLIAKSYK